MLRKKLPYILCAVFFFGLFVFGCLLLYFAHSILPASFDPSDTELATFALGFGSLCMMQGFWSFIDSCVALIFGEKEKVR